MHNNQRDRHTPLCSSAPLSRACTASCPLPSHSHAAASSPPPP